MMRLGFKLQLLILFIFTAAAEFMLSGSIKVFAEEERLPVSLGISDGTMVLLEENSVYETSELPSLVLSPYSVENGKEYEIRISLKDLEDGTEKERILMLRMNKKTKGF